MTERKKYFLTYWGTVRTARKLNGIEKEINDELSKILMKMDAAVNDFIHIDWSIYINNQSTWQLYV